MSLLKFGDSQWLELLWVAAAMLVFGFFYIYWIRKNLERYFGARNAKHLTAQVSATRKKLSLALQCLSVAFFALALARPQMGVRRTEVKQTGLELIIALDVSNSMLAEDDKPSRLKHAQHELIHLLDQIPGHKVGVIAFAGSAVLISPLTSDHSAVRMFIDSLNPESVSQQGTNFRDVIDEALRAFDRGGVDSAEGIKPSRVLLVATDGEDNESGLESALKKAKDQGLRIYSLGFGSARGAPIPQRDARGNLLGYKKDRSGQPVLSVPNEKALEKLATAGGGRYYHGTPGEEEVKSIAADLGQLQLVDFKSQMSTEYDEKYQYPLMLALLFAFFELLIGDRKRSKRKWFGRFATMAFILFSSSWATAFAPPMIESNNEGLSHYQAENYPEAIKKFAEALARDPYNSTLHLNLGDALYKSGELQKALAEFESAAQMGQGDEKFKALFNAGNVAVESKNIDAALKYYQKALALNPQSKEVKTNIELALKQKNGNNSSSNKPGKDPKEGDKGQDNKQNGDDKNKDDQDKGNQSKNDQSKNDQGKSGEKDRQRQKPKPFKSQELSEQDVKAILEELKRQEDSIRAKQNLTRKKSQDKEVEKDW